MITGPVQGIHYPGSLPEMRRWFASDEACLDYLDWLRWPDGFECPWCAGVADWSNHADRHRCGDCHRHVTPTAGTVFHGTRTPLSVWFEAAWLLTASKQGLSALELQHVTGMGSYQTAWTILHKLRTVMAGERRDRLSGRVEVDESFYGGFRPGHRGREPEGKTLVAAAVERRGQGIGRIRMRLVPSASSADLADFIAATVEPESTLVTDGWRAYQAAARRANVQHEPHVLPDRAQAHLFLPGVHRVFSLSKRVLEGTYQGGVQSRHLQAYLDEFVFRFNRRNARARGLLFLRLLEEAMGTKPAPYRDLVIAHETVTRPRPAAGSRGLPASLAGRPLKHPWRTAA